MAVTLVLVRHGQAERKKIGQTDIERSLTPEGLRALGAAFPTTFSLVEVTQHTELWVSPALRARQTAEVANETLRIPDERQFDCRELFDQDEAEFLDLVAASDADTIVAVGHIPFMNRLTEYLSGQPVAFDTGGVAAIRIDDPRETARPSARYPGRLLWFVQGPEV
jgi:phosphohistidine phosphatase